MQKDLISVDHTSGLECTTESNKSSSIWSFLFVLFPPLQWAQLWFTDTDLNVFEDLFEWSVFLHEKDETTWTAHTYDNANLYFLDRTDQPINASYSRLQSAVLT